MSARLPTEPGRYLDAFGNTWRLWNDGLFRMLGHSDADPERYGPWQKLVVAEEPEQSRASVFIQYKGTDICLDFHCICERDEDEGGHFDGYFAHTLKCGRCGRLYEMPHTLTLQPVDTSEHEPNVIHPDGQEASHG